MMLMSDARALNLDGVPMMLTSDTRALDLDEVPMMLTSLSELLLLSCAISASLRTERESLGAQPNKPPPS
jgi:hypothetical protein